MRNVMDGTNAVYEPEALDENVTSVPENHHQSLQLVPLDTLIGLVLAFSSCFFIGISVIYKKLALKDLEVLFLQTITVYYVIYGRIQKTNLEVKDQFKFDQ